MFDHDYFNGDTDDSTSIDGAGFLIRVRNEGVGIFNAYAIFCSEQGDSNLSVEELMALGKAKFICGINSGVEYKAIIEVEANSGNYGNALPQVVVSIANQTITNPPTSYVVWTQFNTAVAMLPLADSFFNIFWVRPIYVFVYGVTKAGHRCEMFFYNIKCQMNVVTETDNPPLGS